MDGIRLYKSIKLCGNLPVYIDYYIVTESISASYCDLKRYGIKIEKTTLYEGGGKIIESKQISNIFYREGDALTFAERVAENRTEPSSLRIFVEKYIAEGLDRAKQKT